MAMVKIAVFHRETGAIRQIVTCLPRDAHLQHKAFENHDWHDITDQAHLNPHPDFHVICPVTRKILPK
jgi:hypothetical protein